MGDTNRVLPASVYTGAESRAPQQGGPSPGQERQFRAGRTADSGGATGTDMKEETELRCNTMSAFHTSENHGHPGTIPSAAVQQIAEAPSVS